MSETRPAASQRAARRAGVALVALPTLLFTAILVREIVVDPGAPALNTAFHAVLILALLVAAVEFGTSITRTSRAVPALALGLGGVVAIIVGAVGSELFGPALLLLLVIAEVVAAVLLARSARRTVSPGQADPASA